MNVIFVLLFFYSNFALAIGIFAFFKKTDPCSGTPAIGTSCSGGSIYAGQFDGGKYMITPGNCNDSSTPICSGGTDTLAKAWRGSTGSNVDISTLPNHSVESGPSSSSYRGHVTTPLIVADASISSDSAADYCDQMSFGGYTDWYLPSKSELAYLYCQSTPGVHNNTKPEEDVNCASTSGPQSNLPGFRGGVYISSSERNSSSAWSLNFSDGNILNSNKSTNYYIRCVRRY